MPWDTDGTKRKILEAATVEFARRGPDGTTIEQIAKLAGVNKERLYNYFGSKPALFALVLREQLTTAAQSVAVESFGVEDVGEYAGRLYDYHRQHPELVRLLQWEGLTADSEVPDEAQRREFYGKKTDAFRDGQATGVLSATIGPDLLYFLVLSLAAYWAMLPQVARMITGTADDQEDEHARRRASVVEAARRLAEPAPDASC